MTSLGGELVGGETSWWRDDRIPDAQTSNTMIEKKGSGGGGGG